LAPRDVVILLVEDNPDHTFFIRLAAERALPDLDVRGVPDGRQCVSYLQGGAPFEDRDEHPFPHLVILDLVMPHLDGFGVLDWIAGQPGLADLPVVVLTSSVNPADEARALSMGARAFHSKPADVLELAAIVAAIVERHVSSNQ
jgi:CheY-like chemotaxis protein